MKVKDESKWQQQCAEFAKDDDPRAEAFRDFVVAWADAAEEQVGELSAIDALKDTLRAVERQVGPWPVNYLGMALVLLSTHWHWAGDPQDFALSLSPIEQSLYFDILAINLRDLQTSAAEDAHG